MEIDEKIKSLINENNVCLFMKGTPESPQCGFSMAVSNVLKHLNVKFKGINVGAGKGEKIDTIIFGGQVGLIFDGRGRPLDVGSGSNKRISNLKKWASALNEYPELKE